MPPFAKATTHPRARRPRARMLTSAFAAAGCSSGPPRPHRAQVVIPGKKDTMWEGCEFNLTMEFSSDYPATAPVVKFVSRSVLRVGNTWSRR